MDDLHSATKLISELTAKLAELDGRVSAYRLDMASEFTRYSEELLRSVPEDVAYLVSQAISESLRNYPSLYPAGCGNPSRSPLPTPTPNNLESMAWLGKTSPPPPQEARNSVDVETAPGQRSPHERELEFHGLFTPTFLPLLESVDRPSHSPAVSPGTADAARAGRRPSIGEAQSSEDTRPRPRPSPLRRGTDTSVDSLASDSSNAKNRKSALRRSSGSSRPDSPREHRRVRFDFQGQEVLPSSSPQTSADMLRRPEGAAEKSALAGDPYATSLSDLQGEEDQLLHGPPKKVSSTQALRRLSKEPLDEGTVWTVVNAETGPESSSSRETDGLRKATASSTPSQQSSDEGKIPAMKIPERPDEVARVQAPAVTRNDADKRQHETTKGGLGQEDDDSDEEPALFMASKKTKVRANTASGTVGPENLPSEPATPQPMRSEPTAVQTSFSTLETAREADQIEASGGTRSTKASRAVFQDKNNLEKQPQHGRARPEEEDDEEFFAFDDDEENGSNQKTQAARSRTAKYLTETQDDEPEKDGFRNHHTKATLSDSGGRVSPPTSAGASTSARTGPRPALTVPAQHPPRPEGTRQLSTSIGSYAGRPLMPGPVKDQEILKELESVDADVPFFVGSVNGRSGPDASNIKSYQASLLSPNQMSGSFAERFMWEKEQGVSYDSDKDEVGDIVDKAAKKTR